MKTPLSFVSQSFVFCALIAWSDSSARAQTTTQSIYHVSIKTSQLQDHGAEPFSLEMVLLGGSDLGSGNALVIVSNINFDADGYSNGDPELDGSVSGDLASALTLTDAAGEATFLGEFTPGAKLTFDMYATLTVEANGGSDEFIVAIQDGSETRIPTLDVYSGNVLARLTTSNGVFVSAESYRTDSALQPAASGPPLSFGPQVLLDGTDVPTNAPVLSVKRNGNGTNTVSWPADFGEFNLQESTNFLSWGLSALSPTQAGTNFSVTVLAKDPDAPPRLYFRLEQ